MGPHPEEVILFEILWIVQFLEDPDGGDETEAGHCRATFAHKEMLRRQLPCSGYQYLVSGSFVLSQSWFPSAFPCPPPEMSASGIGLSPLEHRDMSPYHFLAVSVLSIAHFH